jgi:putative ABC transport system permease protein
MDYLPLSYAQISFAALLIIVNGVISIALRLRMEWSLLLASVRTVVQLLLIGFVLDWVFQLDRSWYDVVALGFVMTLIAGYTAATRSRRRFPGMWFDAVISVWASSWIVTAFALLTVFRGIDYWWQPQYVIPLLGMVLGNSLNGISVGVSTLTEALTTRRNEVETLLSLGATRWEAARGPIQHAVRTGMIPIINSMMVVGIVSLPGMMTGQLLAGVDPTQAVRYQIVIMFLIASATAMGTVGVVLLSYRRLFNANHQFRFDLITSPQSRLVTAVKKIGHEAYAQKAKHKEKR